MPFKSKAQMRKFAVMERNGELPPGTFEKWMSKTGDVKRLPERKSRGKKRGRKK